MAPIEDLQARDLAWISDFVMQQMAIMLHPVMDHLEQTDETADYTQRAVERLSSDISELRGDLERTNKYLAILRQGLGMQNEGRCVLQRTVESTTRTVSRLDDNMDNMLGVVRRAEESIGQLSADMRDVGSKHKEISKHVTESTANLEDLQVKVESISNDAHLLKDQLLNYEARMEVYQRDIRELRRNQLGIAPKFDEKASSRQDSSSQSCRATCGPGDHWPQKKAFRPAEAAIDALSAACSTPDSEGNGSTQQQKKISRVGSASRRGLLQPELKIGTLPSRSSSQAVLYDSTYPGMYAAAEGDDCVFGSCPPSSAVADESTPSSRLPLLAKQPSATRPPDSAYATGVRLRFSETFARQSSHSSLN
mmetsp:Transcript_60105/g.105176  ORF Transcript_60105/g.105176 Transcript_60105/m.105176 type:complete len:366 (+) Transcript_60105:186-1283(+)